MERELWPGLVRWVGASETTNRGVSSDPTACPTGAPGYYPTAPQRRTKSQDSPRLTRMQLSYDHAATTGADRTRAGTPMCHMYLSYHIRELPNSS